MFKEWVEKAIQVIRGVRWKDTVNARAWVAAKQCKEGLAARLSQQVIRETRNDQGVRYHKF